MPYYSSTIADGTSLATAIQAFAISNGWTLTGDWISKGNSAIKLTGSANEVRVYGACSPDGTLNPCPFQRSIYNTVWPATYHLFAHTNPDMIFCVLNYNISYIQLLMFGDIVKVHNDAYVGGNYFFAPRNPTDLARTADTKIEEVGYCNLYSYGSFDGSGLTSQNPLQIPFAHQPSAAEAVGNPSNGLHAEIDGEIWNSRTNNSGSTMFLLDHTRRLYNRSPNQWNNQSILIPMHIEKAATAYFMYLGYIEHIRLVRIDYYNIGDIIDLSPDKWKVFPWMRKNTAARDGEYNITGAGTHTGTFGFAIRYDGA